MVRLLLAGVLLTSGAPMAGEVEHARVKHKNNIYYLDLEVYVDAKQKDVYKIVTDYDQLDRISKILVETARIRVPESDQIRRRLTTQTCILFFCFKVVMIEDVDEVNNELIKTRIVPGISDFKSGNTEWHVNAIDNGNNTRIRFTCELEPGFWIPPVIGPYIMKRKMLHEARQSIDLIEVLANNE